MSPRVWSDLLWPPKWSRELLQISKQQQLSTPSPDTGRLSHLKLTHQQRQTSWKQQWTAKELLLAVMNRFCKKILLQQLSLFPSNCAKVTCDISLLTAKALTLATWVCEPQPTQCATVNQFVQIVCNARQASWWQRVSCLPSPYSAGHSFCGWLCHWVLKSCSKKCLQLRGS